MPPQTWLLGSRTQTLRESNPLQPVNKPCTPLYQASTTLFAIVILRQRLRELLRISTAQLVDILCRALTQFLVASRHAQDLIPGAIAELLVPRFVADVFAVENRSLEQFEQFAAFGQQAQYGVDAPRHLDAAGEFIDHVLRMVNVWPIVRLFAVKDCLLELIRFHQQWVQHFTHPQEPALVCPSFCVQPLHRRFGITFRAQDRGLVIVQQDHRTRFYRRHVDAGGTVVAEHLSLQHDFACCVLKRLSFPLNADHLASNSPPQSFRTSNHKAYHKL